MLMVKPGMPYLDLVREVKDKVRFTAWGGMSQPPPCLLGGGWSPRQHFTRTSSM